MSNRFTTISDIYPYERKSAADWLCVSVLVLNKLFQNLLVDVHFTSVRQISFLVHFWAINFLISSLNTKSISN